MSVIYDCLVLFLFYYYRANRDLTQLTHSFPTLRSSDLGSIAVKGGDHGFFEGTAVANIPLSNNLSTRLVVRHGEQDGLGRDGLSDKDRKSTRLNPSH